MDFADKYEAVIGLEVHVQLNTKRKLFAAETVDYNQTANVHTGIVSAALPGSLPILNRAAVESAIKLGLSCDCSINLQTQFDRKHYFYPDLPPGYQISQNYQPICKGGKVPVWLDGSPAFVELSHIHLESDAGKSFHDKDEKDSYIDLNRAGTALLEIVTSPTLKSAEEAYQFIYEIRTLVRHLNISNGNMEEGSLRCDANISVRLKGEQQLNPKVEVKNVNSFNFVKKALLYEFDRQAKALEAGETISEHTRKFDPSKNITFALRQKEKAKDYRYFADPDIPTLQITAAEVESIKAKLATRPFDHINSLVEKHSLPLAEAKVLVEDKASCDYLMTLLNKSVDSKLAATFMLGPVKSWLNEQKLGISDFPISVESLAKLIDLVQENKVSISIAKGQLFDALVKADAKDPLVVAKDLNVLQRSDDGFLEDIIQEILASNPEKVQAYKNGKKGLLGFFMGELMRKSQGKANPQKSKELLAKHLA